jgi:hypothetical protein
MNPQRAEALWALLQSPSLDPMKELASAPGKCPGRNARLAQTHRLMQKVENRHVAQHVFDDPGRRLRSDRRWSRSG